MITAENLIKSLKKNGVSFKSFQLNTTGEYEPEDVDWNYKDILHVEHVHDLLDTTPITLTDYSLTTMNRLKVLFFHMKYIGFQYDAGANEIVYLSHMGPFFMVVNSKFYKSSKSKTDVISKYNVGSNKLLLNLFFPLVKWAITRNYDKLMIGDIMMRERKGALRKLGISFARENERYTFAETTKLNKKNCVYKPSIFNGSRSSKVSITKKVGSNVIEFLTGISDPWGLRGIISKNKLAMYPRMCDHEGACLDNAILNNNIMTCPWHGKRTKAIHEEIVTKNMKFTLIYNNKSFNFIINNDLIKLTVT
tara:strand:+ start:76 stop:996 length:921 start_codon:yes stop_codon:yes gene_type:complete